MFLISKLAVYGGWSPGIQAANRLHADADEGECPGSDRYQSPAIYADAADEFLIENEICPTP